MPVIMFVSLLDCSKIFSTSSHSFAKSWQAKIVGQRFREFPIFV